MKNNMKHFLKGLAVGLTMVGMVGGIAYATTLTFVQTPTVALYASLSSTGTSMRITPYPKDLDGTKLTMTDFGSSPTVTVDPKKSNIEEIVGFTGITDNGDNTATLSGLSRDLLSKFPYTTVGTGRSHSAGALVVFSNNPQMYARLAALENTEAITGLWAFATSPTVPTPTTATQAVNKGYADGLAFAGVATSTEINFGGVWLSTQLQMASSTYTANAPAALYSRYATSSPYKAGLWIPITQNDGTLNPNFIATSSTSTYNWQAANVFQASTTFIANASNKVSFNALSYDWSGARGASSSVLTENGSGHIAFQQVAIPRYVLATSTAISVVNGYATSTVITIPANVMTASSTIDIYATVTCTGSAASNCGYQIQNSTGAPFVSAVNYFAITTSQTAADTLHIQTLATTTGAQITLGTHSFYSVAGSIANFAPNNYVDVGYSAFNLLNSFSIYFVVQSKDANATATLRGLTIIVNP